MIVRFLFSISFFPFCFIGFIPYGYAMEDIIAGGIFAQAGPPREFYRYALGMSGVLVGVGTSVKAFQQGNIKRMAIGGLLALGGLSILKPKDFLGWQNLAKEFWHTPPSKKDESGFMGGIYLNIIGASCFFAKNAANIPYKLFSFLFSENNAKKIIFSLGVGCIILGNGVSRKNYKPQPLIFLELVALQEAQKLKLLEDKIKDFIIPPNELKGIYYLLYPNFTFKKDSEGKLILKKGSSKGDYLDWDINDPTIGLQGLDDKLLVFPREIVMHIASFLLPEKKPDWKETLREWHTASFDRDPYIKIYHCETCTLYICPLCTLLKGMRETRWEHMYRVVKTITPYKIAKNLRGEAGNFFIRRTDALKEVIIANLRNEKCLGEILLQGWLDRPIKNDEIERLEAVRESYNNKSLTIMQILELDNIFQEYNKNKSSLT